MSTPNISPDTSVIYGNHVSRKFELPGLEQANTAVQWCTHIDVERRRVDSSQVIDLLLFRESTPRLCIIVFIVSFLLTQFLRVSQKHHCFIVAFIWIIFFLLDSYFVRVFCIKKGDFKIISQDQIFIYHYQMQNAHIY